MESGLTATTFSLLRQFGYLALFAFLFLETSMLFPLLPSEVVVPFAAGVLVGGPVGIVLFGGVAAAGAVAGALVAYYAFGGSGNRAADRVPDRLLDGDDVDRARRWFAAHGEGSVLWGRLLPFVRSVISVPAGVARMDVWKFALYTGVGAFTFNAAVAALVYWGKRHSLYEAVADYLFANPVQGAVLVGAAALVAVLVRGGDLSDAIGR